MGSARFRRWARRVLRATVACVALGGALVWLGVWDPGGGGEETAVAGDPARAIAPLGTVPVPRPQNLGQFVKDQSAGIALGKALFWDMQVGSDGVTSCASCHFAAGADSRAKNQLNPRVGPFVVHRPNAQLAESDFPFHRLTTPSDRHSDVLFDTDEVAGSAGVVPSAF